MKVVDTISSNPIKSKCLEVVGLTLVVDGFPPMAQVLEPAR